MSYRYPKKKRTFDNNMRGFLNLNGAYYDAGFEKAINIGEWSMNERETFKRYLLTFGY